MERETSINKYLPKNGFLKISLKAMTNFKRLASEIEDEILNDEETGFCTQMDFNLLCEDLNL